MSAPLRSVYVGHMTRSADELNAVPIGTVIVSREGYALMKTKDGWTSGNEYNFTSAYLTESPAEIYRVLHVPPGR